jgi:hypothetical protein
MGRLCAVGICAVPLRTLGVCRRALGLVPGRLRRAAVVGARAGRLGGRLRLELVGDGRRSRLWMGSAGVGRAVSAVVGTLLARLLGALQPALCGECCRAQQSAPDALCQLECARRRHRDVGIGAGHAEAGSGKSRPGSGRQCPECTGACQRAARAQRARPHSDAASGGRRPATGLHLLSHDRETRRSWRYWCDAQRNDGGFARANDARPANTASVRAAGVVYATRAASPVTGCGANLRDPGAGVPACDSRVAATGADWSHGKFSSCRSGPRHAKRTAADEPSAAASWDSHAANAIGGASTQYDGATADPPAARASAGVAGTCPADGTVGARCTRRGAGSCRTTASRGK